MSDSSWTISTLLPADLENFAHSQFIAFEGNSLHDVVFPTHQAAVDAYNTILADHASLPPGHEIHLLKAVDNASRQIIGGIKVCYYASEDVETRSPYEASLTSVEEATDDDERYRRTVLNAFLGKRIADIRYPHALIDILFVHPDHHRKGLGRALVGRSCGIADEKGLPTIVEASPMGQRTYEGCGFVNMGPVKITPQSWPSKPEHLYYWMEREAKPVSE